jgi:hypothetical protein
MPEAPAINDALTPTFTLTMSVVSNIRSSPKAKDALLARFQRGQDVDDLADWWDKKLDEDRFVVVDDYYQTGLVEPMPLAEKLEWELNLAQLKPLCKARGLKVSGRKTELARRLCEADDQGMAELVGNKRIMRLTPSGQGKVMAYYEQENAEYKLAEREILAHLNDGNLTDAIAVSHKYKSNMLWPSGGDEDFDINALSGILSSPLGNDEERFLAALMYLLPENYPGKWRAKPT